MLIWWWYLMSKYYFITEVVRPDFLAGGVPSNFVHRECFAPWWIPSNSINQDQSSRTKAQGSRLHAQGSRLTDQRSRIKVLARTRLGILEELWTWYEDGRKLQSSSSILYRSHGWIHVSHDRLWRNIDFGPCFVTKEHPRRAVDVILRQSKALVEIFNSI